MSLPLPSCDDARSLLAQRLDTVLMPEAEAILDRHLSACRVCAQVAEEQAHLDALLSRMDGPPPSRGFADGVIQALDRAPADASVRPMASPRSLRRAVTPTLAVGAVAAAVALLVPETAAASALETLVPPSTLSVLPAVNLPDMVQVADLGFASWLPADMGALAALVALGFLAAQVLWVRSRDHEGTA